MDIPTPPFPRQTRFFHPNAIIGAACAVVPYVGKQNASPHHSIVQPGVPSIHTFSEILYIHSHHDSTPPTTPYRYTFHESSPTNNPRCSACLFWLRQTTNKVLPYFRSAVSHFGRGSATPTRHPLVRANGRTKKRADPLKAQSEVGDKRITAKREKCRYHRPDCRPQKKMSTRPKESFKTGSDFQIMVGGLVGWVPPSLTTAMKRNPHPTAGEHSPDFKDTIGKHDGFRV